MTFRKLFPCVLAVTFSMLISSVAVAQKGETRSRMGTQLSEGADQLALRDTEPIIVSEASLEDINASRVLPTSASSFNFNNLIMAAIDDRLGSRYRWGATGPSAFDCSGFVWSTFQSAGILFERASARNLWARFPEPTESEKFKFGTLVFFRHLAHVGIVADEHGFYHASRHHGVVYSPFNDYWLARLDGFRRVPMPVLAKAE
jgi:cell wall-associated NlpC family hydrolase